MQPAFKVLNLEEKGPYANRTFAFDVLEGLSGIPKSLPSKYLYDEKGSLLFEQIMELEEYYPTNCELEILKKCKKELRYITEDEPFRLVELGVGDAKKTKVLLHHLLEQNFEFEYVPIDCCKEMVAQVVTSLKSEFAGYPLRVMGITAEYSTALFWLSRQNSMRNIVLFLGSSIGNFDQQEVRHFLHQMWNAMGDGDCAFIGFDLKKDISTLERAYNDAEGVTKAFNLNLLDRMNRELDADFDKTQFIHHSFYNPTEGRMESWLISRKAQTVTIAELQKAIEFQSWEGIHVENSYKYTTKDIEKLAETMGFVIDDELMDSKGYFVEAIWHVKKLPSLVMEAKP